MVDGDSEAPSQHPSTGRERPGWGSRGVDSQAGVSHSIVLLTSWKRKKNRACEVCLPPLGFCFPECALVPPALDILSACPLPGPARFVAICLHEGRAWMWPGMELLAVAGWGWGGASECSTCGEGAGVGRTLGGNLPTCCRAR